MKAFRFRLAFQDAAAVGFIVNVGGLRRCRRRAFRVHGRVFEMSLLPATASCAVGLRRLPADLFFELPFLACCVSRRPC